MSFMQEFKEFAVKGNVVDMAVGVIIGGAFGKIVSSLVGDVVMPIVGRIVGGVDFGQLYLNLGDQTYDTLEAAEKAGAPLVKYGAFINATIDFVIIAFVIFPCHQGDQQAEAQGRRGPCRTRSRSGRRGAAA